MRFWNAPLVLILKYSGDIDQHHGYWCHGCLCHQVISSHGINSVGCVPVLHEKEFQPLAPSQHWGEISMIRNENIFLCYFKFVLQWLNRQLPWCTGHFNSLWPSNAIWHHIHGSTLAQVMAWRNQYLNQCWLLISEFQWHSPESIFHSK